MSRSNEKKFMRPELANSYHASFTSFSGCDIVASIKISDNIAPLVLGELQTITYSTHREVVPVRTLGRANPVGFTSGQRTIAGSLIFTVFNKNIVYEILELIKQDENLSKNIYKKENQTFLMDEMPPFDVTIIMQNEYGCASGMAIKGIVIVDEGQVMSIEDMLTENTMSYMATDIVPLNSIELKTITKSSPTTESSVIDSILDGEKTITSVATLKDLQVNQKYSDYILLDEITISRNTEIIISNPNYVIAKDIENGINYYAKVLVNEHFDLGYGFIMQSVKLMGQETIEVNGKYINMPVLNGMS